MNIEEARKQVRTNKPRGNFIMVQIGYGNNIVLPFDQGIKLVEAMQYAEVYDTPYKGIHRIKPIPQDTVHWKCLSAQEYEDIKVAALLEIPWDEFTKAKETPTQ